LVDHFGSSLNKPKKKEKVKPVLPTLETSNASDVVRVDTDLAINDILVFDKQGNPVSGLTRQDFKVSEDKISQDIAVFSHESNAIPRSIVLIIDHSYSQLPYITTSITAAKILVDRLNSNDSMAIVTDDIKLIAEPTSDKALLKERLETLKIKTLSGDLGDSKQYSSLMAALKELFDSHGSKPIVIFQTDGDELNQLKPGRVYGTNIGAGQTSFSYDDILDTAERQGVTIYAVYSGLSFIGLKESERISRASDAMEAERSAAALLQRPTPAASGNHRDRRFIKTLASYLLGNEIAVSQIAGRTGGITQTLQSPSQATEIYERILSDMNRRYVIGYYPTNQERDGKRREVKIEVIGHPEFTIWGRKSYLAPMGEIAVH